MNTFFVEINNYCSDLLLQINELEQQVKCILSETEKKILICKIQIFTKVYNDLLDLLKNSVDDDIKNKNMEITPKIEEIIQEYIGPIYNLIKTGYIEKAIEALQNLNKLVNISS